MDNDNLIVIQGNNERQKGIRYEVDSSVPPLGEGGTGSVRRGYMINEKTGARKEVAVKFLFDDLADSSIARSEREASIHIVHENLVEMLGFVKTGEETIYGKADVHYHVVSELLSGVMLFDVLKGKVNGPDGVVFPKVKDFYDLMVKDRNRFAIKIVRNVLSGIMTLHDHGYIHRDVDPSNIMITHEGKVKLIDLGIAKPMANISTQDQMLTTAGQFVGKASYAAPELVQGDTYHQNETTDIYAIGILLYQIVTGDLPFKGPVNEVLEMQLHKSMPLNRIKDKGLKYIIGKATEKKQGDRYQTAAEFRADVDRWLRGDKFPSGGIDPELIKKIVTWGAFAGAAIAIGASFALFV